MERPSYTRHWAVQTPLEFRDFDGAEGDGRTVYGRVIPYGEVIDFYDEHDGNKHKRERFEVGSLKDAVRGWDRVALNFEHLGGFPDRIGYGREAREQSDGGWATFRLYPQTADRAREMMQSSHRGLSLEFQPVYSEMDDDGIIVRKKVRVRAVAITMEPAYVGAQVLSVRSAADLDNNPEPELATPNLAAALAILEQIKRDGGAA
jgi:uncharacterized protein